jgi:hypothetical protein
MKSVFNFFLFFLMGQTENLGLQKIARIRAQILGEKIGRFFAMGVILI